MNVLNTDQAPGAIGPYSQGFEVNGFVFASGQIPVDPASGEVPEGIAAQAEQSCKNAGAILESVLKPSKRRLGSSFFARTALI